MPAPPRANLPPVRTFDTSRAHARAGSGRCRRRQQSRIRRTSASSPMAHQELLAVQRVKAQQPPPCRRETSNPSGPGQRPTSCPPQSQGIRGACSQKYFSEVSARGHACTSVEEQQGVGGVHGGSRQCFYLRKKGCRRDVRLEKGAIQRLGGKVDVKNAFEVLSGERQDGIRLSHLACAVDNQGLPAYGMAPIAERSFDFSLHDALLS